MNNNIENIIPGGRSLKTRIGWFLENPIMSDLKFIVGEENQEFPGHKFMFAASSNDFYNGFYAMTPADNIIRLPEIKINSFKEFLSYIYTEAANINPVNILDIMRLAVRYEITDLMIFCYESATEFIDNELHLFDDLLKFGVNYKDLVPIEKFFVKISNDPLKYLTEENVGFLKEKHLKIILETVETKSSEKDLFELSIMWAKKLTCSTDPLKIRKPLCDLIQLIRFPTMTAVAFEECVSENDGVLETKDIFNVLAFINKTKMDCKYPVVKRQVEDDNNIAIRTETQTDVLINEANLEGITKLMNHEAYHGIQFSVQENCLLEGITIYVIGKIPSEFRLCFDLGYCGPLNYDCIETLLATYKSDNTKESKKLLARSIEKRRYNFRRQILLEKNDVYRIDVKPFLAEDKQDFEKTMLCAKKMANINGNGNIFLKDYVVNDNSPIAEIHWKRI